MEKVVKEVGELASWSVEQALDAIHHPAVSLWDNRKAPERDGRASFPGSVFTQQSTSQGREVTEHKRILTH